MNQDEIMAVKFGKAYAESKFNDMLNVNFHGPNFHWDHFPEMFAKGCKANLFLHYNKMPKNLDELKKIAEKYFISHGVNLKNEYAKKKALP